ncbi:cytochrome b5 [Venturia nashicola]|uniref:Cytochrome b5 n=1 Tax=Venturia nashicola TaxID=86259 RepID=A0A4Z1NWW9_9PEZI|nr:cytochrome b5 [Venturia nashicola]TLD27643.1 cytochrome b5 [Venturia nashicola]
MAENEARRRVPVTKTENESATPQTTSSTAEKRSGINVVDILRGITGLLLLTAALSWFITGESIVWNWRQLPTLLGSAKRAVGGEVLLTDAELAQYDGTDLSKPIYVGLNGSIYDVSASPQTYGAGGGYSFFSGKDAARAFVTGCFQEDLTPDLRGVEDMYIPIDSPSDATLSKRDLKIRREQELRQAKKKVKEGIAHWATVFSGETGKPYFLAGRIKREKGWLDKLPKRALCKAAQEGRPQREENTKA